jgi:hypothetical protein
MTTTIAIDKIQAIVKTWTTNEFFCGPLSSDAQAIAAQMLDTFASLQEGSEIKFAELVRFAARDVAEQERS